MLPRLATLAAIALFSGGLAAAAEPPTIPGPAQTHPRYSVVGMASWYGADFHGHPTANGETFNMWSLSAANRTMPLPSYVRVTNLRNGRSIVVRVNDRGPFVGGRILDVSARAATLLDFGPGGVAKVRVDYLGKAPAAGSDGPALLASLQMGGAPPAPTLVKLAGSDGPALSAAPKSGGAPATPTLVKLAGSDGPALSASQQPGNPPAATDRATPVAGSNLLLVNLQTSGPAAAEPVPLVARAPADEGVTVIERAVERPPAAEPRSPFGDLVTSPFLVQAVARP